MDVTDVSHSSRVPMSVMNAPVTSTRVPFLFLIVALIGSHRRQVLTKANAYGPGDSVPFVQPYDRDHNTTTNRSNGT